MKPIFTISTAFIIPFLLSSSSLVSPLPINNDINCAMLDWEEIEKMPYPPVIDRLTGDEVLSSDEWEKLKKFAKELPSGKLKEGFYRALRILSYALTYSTEYQASMINNDTGRSSLNTFDYDRNDDKDYDYFENTAHEIYFTKGYSNGKYSSLDLSSQPSRINEEKIAYPEGNIHCTNDSNPNIENCLFDRSQRQDKNEFTENVSNSTQFLTLSTSENPIETEFNDNIEVLGRNELNNNNRLHALVENNNQTDNETNLNSILNSFDSSDINGSNENPSKIKNYETEGTSTLSMESYTNISNRSTSREQEKTAMEMLTTNNKFNDTSENQTTSSSQESFSRSDFTNNDSNENKIVDSTNETTLTSEIVSTSHTSEKHQSLDYVTTSEYKTSSTESGETTEGLGSVIDDKVPPIDKKEYNKNNNDLNITSSEASSETLSAATVGDPEITTLKSEGNSTMDLSQSSESVFQTIDMHVVMIKPNTLPVVISTVPTIIKSNELDRTINSIDENDRNIDGNKIRPSEETSESFSERTDHNYNLTSLPKIEFNTYSTDSKIKLLNETEISNGKTVIPDSHKMSSEEITQNVNKSDSEEVGSQDHITQTTELTSEYAEKHLLSGASDNLKILPEAISEKEPKYSTISYEDVSTALPTNTEQNIVLSNEINEPEHKMISDEDKTYTTIQTINLTTELEADDKFTLDRIEIDAASESSTVPHYGMYNEKVIKSGIEPNYGAHTIPDSYEIKKTVTNSQDGDIHVTTASTEILSESAPDNEKIIKSTEVPPTAETNTEDDYAFSSDVNNIQMTVASTGEKVVAGNERELDNNHEESSNESIIQQSIDAVTEIDKINATIDSQNIEIATGSTAEQIFVTHTESNYDAGVESGDLLGNNKDVKQDSVEVPPTDGKLTSNYSYFETTTESTTAFWNNVEEEHEGNKDDDETPNSHKILSTIGPTAEENEEINGVSNGIPVTPAMKTEYPHATDDTADPENIGNGLSEQDHGKLDSHEIQLTTQPFTKVDIQLAIMSSTDQHLPGSDSDIDQDINKNVTYTDVDLQISTTEHSHSMDVYITEPVTTSDKYLNDSKTSEVPNEHNELVTHDNREEITTIKEGSNNYYEDYSQSASDLYEKEGYTTPYTIASTDPNDDIRKNTSETSTVDSKFEFMLPQSFDAVESNNQIKDNHERKNQSFSTHGLDKNIEVDDMLIEKSSVPTNTNTDSRDDKQEVLDHTASDFTGNNLVEENNENNYNENVQHQIPTESESEHPQRDKISSSTPVISEKTTLKLDVVKPPEVVMTVGKSSEHMPEFDENIQRISSTINNEFVVTEPNESGSYDGFYPYLSPVSKHYSQNRPLPNPVPQDLKRSNCVKVPEIIYSRR